MTYEFHYPPKPESEQKEERTEEKSLDQYFEEAELEVKEHERYGRDYGFLQFDYGFRSALKTLSDLEIITSLEAENYVKSRDTLFKGLQARVKPEKFSECAAESFLAAGIATCLGALPSVVCMSALALAGYNEADLQIFHYIFLGSFGAGAGAGIGACITGKLRGGKQRKQAEQINLSQAYDAYFEAIGRFRDFDLEDRSYNAEKAEHCDRKKLVSAVNEIKEYVKKVDEQFKDS